MRKHSIAGPLILLLIGGLFLWNNLHPEYPIFDMLGRYWPFLLIAWGAIRLAEVMFGYREGRSGFSGGEIVLVVFICLLGAGVFEAQRHGMRFNSRGLEMFGEQYDYPVSAKGEANNIRRVVFENPRGNVRINGSDSNEVVVSGRKLIRAYNRSEADRADKRTPVEIVTQGDRILIRTNQDKSSTSSQRVAHDLEVTLPRGVIVEAHNNSGDYDVTGMNSDVEIASDRADVRLSRIGGSARIDLGRSDVIRIMDVKGSVQLQGKGSDVELENIEGQVTINGSYSGTLDFKNLAKPLRFDSRTTELRVEALPGRINMDLGGFNAHNVVGPMKLVTKSRDIKVEDFTQSLELETERGDIELHPGRLPLAKIEARSKTGRIDLVLPDKASFQLDATAERGDAVNDFGPPIQREMEGRTATLKGKVGSGPTIHLTTDRGTVAVRKTGSLPAPDAPQIPKPPTPPAPAKSLADSEVKL